MACMATMDMVTEVHLIQRNNMQKKILLTIIGLYTCLFSFADIERWQVYPSYREAMQVEAAGNYLYCIMKGSGTVDSRTGNLVRYDVGDGSVKTYDCLNELSDKEISRISYNSATGRLLVIYTSGNIDLLDDEGGIVNIYALQDNSILGEMINGVSHFGHIAYLCTDNSIIELDVKDALIVETYKSIGTKAYSMAGIDDMFYVSTSDGLYKIPETGNMHDRSLWESPISKEVYLELVAYQSHLFGRKEKGIDEIELNGTPLNILPNVIPYLVSSDDKLMFGMSSRIYIYEGEYTSRWNNIQFNLPFHITDIACIDGRYYGAEGQNGVTCYELQDSKFVNPIQVFNIDSPRRDLFYHIHFAGERLLSAGGINTQTASYYPSTFMFMDDNTDGAHWTLFDEKALKTSYPKLSHYNSVDLVQDPLDDKHFFGAVYRNGLHEYRMDDDGKVNLVKLYNYENSPLQCIAVNTSSPWNYCTCTALQYDEKGNLWMANQQTDTIIRVMRPNGKWLSLYYPEIICAENVFQYLFSSHGINFMVTYGGEKRGFFGFDTNGTLNVADDDRRLIRNTITNQDGTSVLPTQFYCMTEDKDRQIWCGTNEGLFVITRPQDWFDPDFRFHQIKRNRNDGSGFADYLLSGVDITCIAVDPSNRKWIGTLSNGVYLVSHDGQETIHHFTKDNSPLLSDRIHSIAVHPRDGRVMFGTDAGLCSYAEDVIEAENILSDDNVVAYPNPVRPNTNAIVTIQGLTDGAEVKILSSSGQAVWGAKSIGGSVKWNCCNMQGRRVASGVYHVVCNTEDAGQNVVTRIIVLR